MVGLVLLLVGLVGIVFGSYKISKGAFASPEIGFALCFIPQVAYAFLFVKYWDISLVPQTVLTVLGGCLLFAIVSLVVGFLIDKFFTKKSIGISYEASQKNDIKIECSKLHLIAFAVFHVATLVWTVFFLLQVYGSNDLGAAIAYFNDVNKFTDQTIELPFVLGKFRILCLASGYVWSYLLAHSVVYKYKAEKILLAGNMGLCLISSVITGSRTDVFLLVVAFVVCLGVFYGKKNNWRVKITVKAAVISVGAMLAFVLSFQAIGNLLGRGSEIGIIEYIGIYLSAELKNLDIFIREGNFGAPVNRWQTLIEVVNVIGDRLNMPELIHKLDIPFRSVNGHDLGNVATIFYAFLYDFGYLGIIVFIPVMATICQFVYKLAIRYKEKENKISISLIIYSYVYFTIVFSFFSNKFYEHIFSGYFVYMMVFWLLFKVYIEFFTIDRLKAIAGKIFSGKRK